MILLAALGVGGCASVKPQPIALTTSRPSADLEPAPLPGATHRAPPVRRTARAGAPYKLGAPYRAGGKLYVPAEQPDYDEVGLASWYGDAFHGRPTAIGEIFDMNGRSAAHATLPLPCIVEVTNLENGKRLRLRLNDRGPFHPGRIIDLSKGAAKDLGFYQKGTARVRVRYVGPVLGGENPFTYASNPVEQMRKLPAPTLAEYFGRPPADPTPRVSSTSQYAAAYDTDLRAFADRIAARPATRIASRKPAAAPAAPAPTLARAAGAGAERPYRVVLGAYATPEEASRIRDDMAALGFSGAEVSAGGQP